MTLHEIETGLAVAVSYIGNPLSMWLAIHRRPFSWWIVAITQAAFVGFAVTSGDWRFGGQALCLAMGVYGVWKWGVRHSHEPAIGDAVIPQPRRSPDDDMVWAAAQRAYEQWRTQSEGLGARAGGSPLPSWDAMRLRYPRRARAWHDVARAVLDTERAEVSV